MTACCYTCNLEPYNTHHAQHDDLAQDDDDPSVSSEAARAAAEANANIAAAAGHSEGGMHTDVGAAR